MKKTAAKPVRLAQQLDKAVDRIMTDRETRLSRADSRIAAILRVAADLRDLPREDFKARLKAELISGDRPQRASGKEEPAMVKSIPEGFHSITPYLVTNGAAKLIEFLKNAFGAEEIFRVPRGAKIAHAQLKIDDSMIEVADAIDKYQPNPTAIWLFVKNSDAVYARALKAGATSIHEPTDQDYGDREASVKDPFGNHWYIATHRADAEPLPDGMHNVTPYLHPKGTAKVIDFLKQAFDAEEVFRAQDSGRHDPSCEDSDRRLDHRDG